MANNLRASNYLLNKKVGEWSPIFFIVNLDIYHNLDTYCNMIIFAVRFYLFINFTLTFRRILGRI